MAFRRPNARRNGRQGATPIRLDQPNPFSHKAQHSREEWSMSFANGSRQAVFALGSAPAGFAMTKTATTKTTTT